MNSRRRVNSTVGLLLNFGHQDRILWSNNRVKRLSTLLIIPLAVLVITVIATSLWLTHSSIEVTNEAAIPAVSFDSKREYRLGMAGEYAGADRHHKAAFSDVYTSDGLSFYRRSDYFDSASRAHMELEKTLKNATDIIRREPLFDKNGHNVGEKVIATFRFNNTFNGPASLLFTDDSTFAYVRGPSLQSVLEYERDMFH
jgi:hypothetical protein